MEGATANMSDPKRMPHDLLGSPPAAKQAKLDFNKLSKEEFELQSKLASLDNEAQQLKKQAASEALLWQTAEDNLQMSYKALAEEIRS